MANRKVYKRFIDLPQGVQDFFMETADAVYADLIEKFNLSQEHFFDLVETPILNTTLGFRTVPEGLNELYRNLLGANLPKDDLRQIIKIILEKVFWPLRDLFNSELTNYLTELQIKYINWPQERVLFRPVSYSGAVSEMVNRLGMHSMGKQARASMRGLVEKYAKGELVPDQVKEVMVRLPEFGGLGFDKDTAQKALEEMQTLFKQVEFLSEEQYAEQLTQRSVKMNGDSKAEAEAGEDEDEIKTIRENMPEKPKVLTELDKAVDDAWAKVEDKPDSEYLQRRLKNVISSRLRDVRNDKELLQLLQRDTKVGGLGLDREKAGIIAEVIEQTYEDYHGKIAAEEKAKLEKQLQEQKRKIEERRKKEAEEHAKWYREKIKEKQESKIEQKQFAEALKQGLKHAPAKEHPIAAKSAAMEKKKYGEMVMAPAAAGAAGGAVKGVRVSAASLRVPQAVKAPVDGVMAAPKLRGLAGELESMTLAQFRRLAAKPQEATQKILQRLDTLKEESFEKKVAGIRGWQASPVMKEYLTLVSESFKSKKPIADIAEEKRQAGEDTLTRDEIEALIQLNNQLHF